jgi:uncharacterized protein YceK
MTFRRFVISFLALIALAGCAQIENNTISNETSASDASWTRVNKETFWHKDDFVDENTSYFPEIAFEHPSTWKFNCCGDTETSSIHLLCSDDYDNYSSTPRGMAGIAPSMDEICGKKYVSIINHALAGCPSSHKWDCGREGVVEKTVQQKYDDEMNGIRTETGTVILPQKHIPSLNVDAFAYAKNDQSRSYLINLGNEIIDIEFFLSPEVNDAFIDKFFSHMTWDKE